MSRQQHRPFISSAKTTRLRILRSDHALLTVLINLTWQHKRKRTLRPCFLALKDPVLAAQFRIDVNSHFIVTAHNLQHAIHQAATALPRQQPRLHRSPWLDDPAIEHLRRSLQSACNRFGQSSAQATEAEAALVDAHQAAIENHIVKVADQLEEANASGKSRLAWKIINCATGRNDRSRAVIAAESSTHRLEKVAEHYHSLLNRQPSVNLPSLQPNYPDPPSNIYSTSSLTFSEIERALKTSRLDGAVGPDDIPTRALHLLNSHVLRVLNHHSVLNKGHAPDIWRQSTIVSLPKKGTLTSLDNIRGISLMCTSPKLYNSVMLKRILDGVMQRLSPLQAGFLPQSSL